jgi:hypothetical protein
MVASSLVVLNSQRLTRYPLLRGLSAVLLEGEHR